MTVDLEELIPYRNACYGLDAPLFGLSRDEVRQYVGKPIKLRPWRGSPKRTEFLRSEDVDRYVRARLLAWLHV